LPRHGRSSHFDKKLAPAFDDGLSIVKASSVRASPVMTAFSRCANSFMPQASGLGKKQAAFCRVLLPSIRKDEWTAAPPESVMGPLLITLGATTPSWPAD
jgi:hypothetical protein